jgi:hypothetical protein
MANISDSWKPLPHSPIQRLSENLWRVEGTIPRMSLKRVMTIVRHSDGCLIFHSPIILDDASMREVETWGRPCFLLVPSGYHRMDSPAYKKRYPAVRVFAPKGSRKKIEEVISVEGTYEEFPEGGATELATLPGVNDTEGVMLVHSNDGVTVVLNDVVMHMDRKRDMLGFLFTTVLGSAPGPRVSRLSKLLMVKDKPALRAELERLSSLPNLVRLIVSHEKMATGDEARDALRTAAAYL